MENYSLPSSSRSVLHTRRCSVLRRPARWHLGHSFWVCLHHSFVLHQHRYDFSGLWCLHVYLFAHRFPPASASYILLQFAQYGNILKHVVSTGKFQDCFIDDLYSIKVSFIYRCLIQATGCTFSISLKCRHEKLSVKMERYLEKP